MKTSLEIFAQNLRDTLEAQRKSQSDLARPRVSDYVLTVCGSRVR